MNDTPTTLARRLSREGQITVRGLDQIRNLRQTLGDLYAAGGLRIEFDPSSSPEWIDYLMVALPTVADAALKGAAVGFILGTLARAVGAQSGVRSVQRGWRIRIGLQDGGPTAHIEVLTSNGGR